MRSNYKRLGDYIQEVNNRNKDLKVTNLLGINIDKFFMPSVANVIGTDMTNYKIVKKGNFACNRMHVGRDERLPISLSKSDEDFLVSPAYSVFEIIDTKVLLPDYLMLWFSRAEFDRNAWFYTDADVRGGLNWKEFCDMQLPIPSPEKQQEIVKEYQVIENRIKLNNSLIQKLEETAQAIYKQWFVDFEFPDENGNPYKSSGGAMEFCKELEMEIPLGWGVNKVRDLCLCNYKTLSLKDKMITIDYLDTSNITNNEIEQIQQLHCIKDEIPSRAKRKVRHNDIIFSTIRPNLRHFGILKDPNINMIVSTGFAVLEPINPKLCSELIYMRITSEDVLQNLQSIAEMSVSTYPSINPEDILNIDFVYPSNCVLEKTNPFFETTFNFMDKKKKENKFLKASTQLLLQRITKV